MSLVTGQSLTFYEILGPIGAGAMGEVYRAKDTRLGREVAIKVLPEHFAEDDERLKRFEREATTLATLNHPNVAQIFGVDQVDSLCFLVLELVPGESLDERLKRGPLRLDEVVDISKQIAEGLEAAHEAGAIHRDLKPANVRITPGGKVKVLDFGLAKSATAGSTAASTDSVLSTEAGRLLGTPTYMAPEQARGKPIDKRVDVWAFGCVLFELLTSQRAFEGDTLTDVLAAVIEREPDWSKLPKATPREVRELLTRCFAKDPQFRLRDIGEARVLLANLGPLEATPKPVRAKARAPKRSRLLIATTITAVLVAGATTYLLIEAFGTIRELNRGLAYAVDESDQRLAIALDESERRFNETIEDGRARNTRLEMDLKGALAQINAPQAADGLEALQFKAVTFQETAERNPSLSGDGQVLVYAGESDGSQDIFRQRVGGSRAVNLTEHLEGEQWQPALSPDGSQIAFRSEHGGGGIFVMGATGESTRRVSDFGYDPAWSPNGKQLAFTTAAIRTPLSRSGFSQLFTVYLAGGPPSEIKVVDAVQPSFSPDGRWIAYWAYPTGGQRDIFMVSSSGGKPIQLTNDVATDWGPVWSPNGSEIVFSSDRSGEMNLWRLEIDSKAGKAIGSPAPLTVGVNVGVGEPSFSSDGSRVAFRALQSERFLVRIPFDPVRQVVTGAPERIVGGRGAHWPFVSPDGEWVAATIRRGTEDLYLVKVDGTEVRQLTDSEAKDRTPSWSPDGSRVYWFTDHSGTYQVWSCLPDGSGKVMHTDDPRGLGYPSVSPDGATLAAATRDGLLFFFDPLLEAKSQVPKYIDLAKYAPSTVNCEGWSSDGAWLLARLTNDKGTQLIKISSDGEETELLGAPQSELEIGGAWIPEENTVLAVSNNWIEVYNQHWDSPEAESVIDLPFDVQGFISVGPDGEWIYLSEEVETADIWVMDGGDFSSK